MKKEPDRGPLEITCLQISSLLLHHAKSASLAGDGQGVLITLDF